MIRLIGAIIISVFFSSTYSQTYIGEVTTHDGYQYLVLEIKKDSTMISFPYETKRSFEFNEIPEKGKMFPVQVNTDQRNFKIKKVDEGQIVLETTFTGYPQTISLRKQSDPQPVGELDSFAGNFIDEYGNRAIVYALRENLNIMSPYAEQTVSLIPIGDHIFWSTTGETTTFTEKANNKFQQISIVNRSGNKINLQRSHDYSVKEDWVMVDGDSIYVNLFLPSLSKNMPACLLLPGGGGQSQMANSEYEARLFASHGVIAMTFDKANVGRSKGQSFENYTFKEKRSRYQQLLEYLKNHERVDPGKVGIHGPSEGGRLALMMGISLGSEVAFINATAAPIMTMKEGQLYAADHYHRNQGVLEEDITSLNYLWENYYEGIIHGKIDTTNFSKIRKLNLKYNRLFIPPTSVIIPISPKEEDLLDDSVATEAGKLVCPVFLQYGENDQRVNPTKSLQNFYIHISDELDITVEIYPRGNHSMMTPEFQICSGYAFDKIKWLKSISIIQ